MKKLSQSLLETRLIAGSFVESLYPLENEALVISLEGDLGAGKTAFTQEVGKALGISENIHSPTFVIMKVYEIDFHGFKKLIHIDAYRLEQESELMHLGWEEWLKDKTNLIFIEWPSHVSGLIPQSAKKVSLESLGEESREITFHENI